MLMREEAVLYNIVSDVDHQAHFSVASPFVFFYRCILPGGFNSNLSYGLEPQVSGIKLSLHTDGPFSKLSDS